jgi:5'-AMP-activated protein kinase, catalytic alpha subunit
MQGEAQHTQTDPGARRYKLLRTLGKGSFSKVKEAVHIISGELVAIKVLDKAMIAKEEDLNRIKREIKILKVANHPNLISLYEIMETDKYYFFVMEHAPGGELSKYICDRGKLDEKTACRMFRQLMKGVEYLANMGCAHRDIKPSNILLKNDQDLKLIDFGLGNFYSKGELLLTPCGSPCYAAPELVTGKTYNGISVDIWSSGITLFAMLCGHLPFNDDSRKELFRKIAACDYKMPDYLSSTAKDLIRKIFQANPNKRISLSEIKEHPWYNLVKEEEVQTRKHETYLDEVAKETDIISLTSFYMKITTDKLRSMIQENQANKYTCCYKLFMEKRRHKRLTKEDLHNIAALRLQEVSTDSSLNKQDGTLSPTLDPSKSRTTRQGSRVSRPNEQYRGSSTDTDPGVHHHQVRLPSIRQELSVNNSTYRGDSTEPPSTKTSKGSGLKRYFIEKLRDMSNSREHSRHSSASRTEEIPAPHEEEVNKKTVSNRYKVETLSRPADAISGFTSRDPSPNPQLVGYSNHDARYNPNAREGNPQTGSDLSKNEDTGLQGNKSRQMLRVVSHKQYAPTALTASTSKPSQVIRTPNMKISLIAQNGQSRLNHYEETRENAGSTSPESRSKGGRTAGRLRIDTGREDSADTSLRVGPSVTVTQAAVTGSSQDPRHHRSQSKKSSKNLSFSGYQPPMALRVGSPSRGVQHVGPMSSERRESKSQDDPKQLANIKTMIKQIMKDSGNTDKRVAANSHQLQAEKYIGSNGKPAEPTAGALSYKAGEGGISKGPLQLRSMISPKAGALRTQPGVAGGFFNPYQKK